MPKPKIRTRQTRNEITKSITEAEKRSIECKNPSAQIYWSAFADGLRKAVEIIDWHAQRR